MRERTPDVAGGPQAGTRNAKERRMSYHTNAARSLAALEQRLESRLALLEGTSVNQIPSNSPNKAESSPRRTKSAAATELDADLEAFGSYFNTIDQRVETLEHAPDSELSVLKLEAAIEQRILRLETAMQSQVGLEARLMAAVEKRVKAHEDDKQKSHFTEQQHREFANSFRTLDQTTKKTAKLVDEHEDSVREFSSRLLEVEDQSELVKTQTLSTRDLARALKQRLQRGDTLDHSTVRDVRMALDGASGATGSSRTLQTPLTDVENTVETSAEPEEDSADAEEERPHKHRRTLPERSAPGFDEAGFVNIPPETRRSGRMPKPRALDKGCITWKEAQIFKKGLRASP